jgi:hypothetical protein
MTPKLTPEQRAKHLRNLRTPARLVRLRETNSTKEFSENVRAGQKEFWAQFTAEEKTRRVRHQMAGMSAEQKSDRMRRAWAGATPEAREERIRKAAAGAAVSKASPAHSKKMSEWQTARQKTLTSEYHRAVMLKAWATRRAKYGEHGAGRAKTAGEYSEGSKKGWANMTPEARSERVRRVQEGRRRARESRNSRLVRINLLRAA